MVSHEIGDNNEFGNLYYLCFCYNAYFDNTRADGIILVVSQAVTHGRKSVVPLAAGVVFGDFSAMTLSLLGLGAIMSASPTLFTLFKWIGALLLALFGDQSVASKPEKRL